MKNETVSKSTVEEIRSLIESGDLSYAEMRDKLEGQVATDEQLLVAMAATDDDDDDLFREKVDAILAGTLVVE